MPNLITQLLNSGRSVPPRARQRTPAAILDCMPPEVRESMTSVQLAEVERLIGMSLPKPSPKIVELRFEVDLIITRYFVALFVGKDRRKQPRRHSVSKLASVLNKIAAVLLLLTCNLAFTGTIFLFVYLIKSSMGFDFLPGHLREIYK